MAAKANVSPLHIHYVYSFRALVIVLSSWEKGKLWTSYSGSSSCLDKRDMVLGLWFGRGFAAIVEHALSIGQCPAY